MEVPLTGPSTEEDHAMCDTPSCWVIFNYAHSVFRSVVNQMEYDIRSGDPQRYEFFPTQWRRFQRFATLHADMEECGFFRLLEGLSSKDAADLVSWEWHQADSDAVIKVDNMLAKYLGRGEVFDKILPVFLEWQDIHFRHLDYEDEAWAPVINNFAIDALRRNQVIHQLVTLPAHMRDPDLCSEYYAWIIKNLSLFGTRDKNPLDATVAFVRGLRCVCNEAQWTFYLPFIRDACTLSIWDHLLTHHAVESPDEHASLLGDHSIFDDHPSSPVYQQQATLAMEGSSPSPPNSLVMSIKNSVNATTGTDNDNSGLASSPESRRFSISFVDVSLARASFALIGTRGSFFQSKKVVPGTEWWSESVEHVNSGKETAAVLSNSQSFHSNSVRQGDTNNKPLAVDSNDTAAADRAAFIPQPQSSPNPRVEQDEFHFNQHILPCNKDKPNAFMRRAISTMPAKLKHRPSIFMATTHAHPHFVHPAPLRSRVVSHIFSSWSLLTCGCGRHGADAQVDDTAHHHHKHHSGKKKSGKKKKHHSNSSSSHQDKNGSSHGHHPGSSIGGESAAAMGGEDDAFTNLADHEAEA